MKAVYVVSHCDTSGPINQALNILLGMKTNGRVDDTLVVIDSNEKKNKWLYRFNENGVHTFELGIKKSFNILSSIRRLRDYIIKNDINVVHCSGFRANLISLFAANRRCVVVSTIRSEPVAVSEKFPKVIRPLFTWMCVRLIKSIPVPVACSKAMASQYGMLYGIHMECVQNGVNTDFFKPASNQAKLDLRKKYGFGNESIYLVLGILAERKNNAIIIEAFKKLDNFKGLLLFVGDGPESESLGIIAEGHNNIVFMGPTASPLDFLQMSDFLISASLAEGLPNTVLEAISCGLIPILSNIEPHLEIVEDTPIKHIFQRNSSAELQELLKESIQWDIDAQSKISREVAQRFGVSKLAEKYEAIYTEKTNIV